LLDYLLFYVPLENLKIHSIETSTIAGEGLQNFGLCSALVGPVFELGGIFIMPQLL
jgi:hypothetical protein